MCTEVEIRRPGLRSLYVGNVRDLSRHLRVIIAGAHLDPHTKISRMATHCLCPVDVRASAEASGWRVVSEPMSTHPDIIIERN